MIARTQQILAFHDSLINKYGDSGDSWAIAGWSSAETQESRFAHLLQASSFRGGTVLDWGCGPGDLYQYLDQFGKPFEYEGVDINPKMIAIARRRHGRRFTQIDPSYKPQKHFDYIFASGIFQFVDVEDPAYFLAQLAQMAGHARIAVASNFLSAFRDDTQKAEEELYLDPTSMISALSAISTRWVIDHSYHPGNGDFTVALILEPILRAWKRPDFDHDDITNAQRRS